MPPSVTEMHETDEGYTSSTPRGSELNGDASSSTQLPGAVEQSATPNRDVDDVPSPIANAEHVEDASSPIAVPVDDTDCTGEAVSPVQEKYSVEEGEPQDIGLPLDQSATLNAQVSEAEAAE